MSDLSNILAQLAAPASVETVLYTVPAQQKARILELIVCNRASSQGSFRVSISALGGATANGDFLYYDLPIPANDTFAAEIDVWLNTTDVIRVFASSASLTFTLIGSNK